MIVFQKKGKLFDNLMEEKEEEAAVDAVSRRDLGIKNSNVPKGIAKVIIFSPFGFV